MNEKFYQIYNQLSKIDQRYIQLALVVITLSLFVLGASAPGALGDY